MKNFSKLTFVTFLFLAISNQANAIDLGKVISGSDGKKIDIAAEFEKRATKELDKVKEELQTKVQNEIERVKGKIESEVAQIENIINKVKDEIKRVEEIKAKAARYILYAKIVIGFLASGVIFLLFMVWRMWRNIVTLRRALTAAVNYKDIKEQISNLEKRVKKLEK